MDARPLYVGERAEGAHNEEGGSDQPPATGEVATAGPHARDTPPIRIDEELIDSPAPRRELSPAEALALVERGPRWRDATPPPTADG